MKNPHYFLCIIPIWLVSVKGFLTIIILINAVFALVAIAGRVAEKQKIFDKTTLVFAAILVGAILLSIGFWLYEILFIKC